MPKPLVIKRPKPAPPAKQLAVLMMVGVPLGYLAFLYSTGRPLYFHNAYANLGAYALLVLLPGCFALSIGRQPLEYLAADEVMISGRRRVSGFRYTWWQSLLVRAGVLSAFALLLVQAVIAALHPEWLDPVSAGSAVMTMFVVALCTLWATTAFGSTVVVRVSEEGVRLGTMTFLDWKDIVRAGERNGVIELFHRVNPYIPMAMFSPDDAAARSVFYTSIAQHQIRRSDETSARFLVLKLIVVVASVVIFLLGLTLYLTTPLDSRWIAVISVGLSIVATSLVERYRGISKLMTSKPQLAPPEGTANP
jgi:hypothetical protein